MSVEYEAKFLEIDVNLMRQKLMESGAKLVHERKRYVRIVFHRCDDNVRGFARIRDEGGQITMTVKIYKDPKFPEEYEISLNSDFETGANFLRALGLKQKAFQETYREKWGHPLVHEITFDDVPGLPTFMEIDCLGENKLKKMIKILKLNETKMRFGGFDATFNEYYGIPLEEINNQTPSLTFKNILNEIKPRKNLELLEQLQKMYNQQKFGKLSKSLNKVEQKIVKYIASSI
jgi:adenylate cyclase, class 2